MGYRYPILNLSSSYRNKLSLNSVFPNPTKSTTMTKGQQIIKECRERMSKYTDAQRLEIKGWADRLATASVSKTDGP